MENDETTVETTEESVEPTEESAETTEVEAAEVDYTEGVEFDDGAEVGPVETTDEEGNSAESEEEGNSAESEEEGNSAESEETEITPEQAKINHAFIKQKKELQREREAREKAEQAAQDAHLKLQKLTGSERPEVPAMPDQFDEDYEAKIVVRDNAIKAQFEYDQKQAALKTEALEKAKEFQQKQMEEINSLQKSYADRVAKLGIDLKVAEKDEGIVGEFANADNADTIRYIMKHKKGPLIVSHLANNPLELELVSKLPIAEASVHIHSKIVPQLSVKTKQTKTPAPLTIPKGKGTPKKESKYLKGVQFE